MSLERSLRALSLEFVSAMRRSPLIRKLPRMDLGASGYFRLLAFSHVHESSCLSYSKLLSWESRFLRRVLYFMRKWISTEGTLHFQHSCHSGSFLESSLLQWQGYTVSVIRNALCFTGCCFITLSNLFLNMKTALRGSMAFFASCTCPASYGS